MQLDQDFKFSKFHIEIKREIRIQTNNFNIIGKTTQNNRRYKIICAVFGIDKSDSNESLSVHGRCNRIADKIYNSDDIIALQEFNNKLNKYGYSEDQDYSDKKWDIKEIIYYEVTDNFRISFW